MKRLASIALLSVLTAPAIQSQNAAPTPASRANENFESGTLANWQQQKIGEGGWFVYTEGKTPPDRTQSDPFYPFEAPNPPQGRFAAISDTNGAGTRILYRDVTLDGRYRVTFSVFYVNEGRFSDPDPPGEESMEDRQLFRIDLMSPSAPVTSLSQSDILASIFRSRHNDPPRQPPTDLTRDLSQWEGRTIRIRLVSADNEGPLRAGVDNIRFERTD
jgi:hypothetical protein